jgi:HD-GYP domain-containing protein (c-di-GMP phosphodiesterase class II)
VDEVNISLFSMLSSISNLINILDDKATMHQEQVAYISLRIAKEFGMKQNEINELIIATSLHDIGAFSLDERLELLDFEVNGRLNHSEIGAALLGQFQYFEQISKIIKYHHLDWNYGKANLTEDDQVPISSHLLHLADRIAVLIDPSKNILGQKGRIIEKIRANSKARFNPELVDQFLSLADKEEFWLSTVTPDLIKRNLIREMGTEDLRLNIDQLLDLSKIFSKIIDYRSKFTLNHSYGVAVTAEEVAKLMGWSNYQGKKIRIAGYLHDLGKLAVATEILEKPGRLSEAEVNIIKVHTFYTYYILDPIDQLSDIKEWAAFHHERLDGKGYPFHHTGKRLSEGSRIMAVVDVFTAVTEDRPYREGMKKGEVIAILSSMAENNALDQNIVDIVVDNYEQINSLRIEAQQRSLREYSNLL